MMAERSVIYFGKQCNQNGYDSNKTVLLERISKNYLRESLVNSVSFIKEACCLRCHWNSFKNSKQSHPNRKNRTSWFGDWLLFLTLTMKYDYKPCGLIMKLKKKTTHIGRLGSFCGRSPAWLLWRVLAQGSQHRAAGLMDEYIHCLPWGRQADSWWPALNTATLAGPWEQLLLFRDSTTQS